MITPEVLTEFVRKSMPDAAVTVTDRTGTMDHLKVVVVSEVFREKSLLDRHRLIYQALDVPMKDGRIHALELTARTTDEKEVKAHKILIYGKGTKTMPMCGFTRETMQFFSKYGYPYELIDVLSQPVKREALTKMTNWPTLPKVFIDGTFYGDTDILDPMEKKGEMEPLLKKAFGK
ncbi:hypothetical protein B566_EDAN000306 [Ephemera danica]|nr:hypothetical protein B566_EDAN000306 [Ephemera danica]